jgi:hypothetical protein
MKALFTKRKTLMVTVLALATLISATVGLYLKSTSPVMVDSCKIRDFPTVEDVLQGEPINTDDLPYPHDIIQIKETLYYVSGIFVYSSHNGCDWSEIESFAANHDIWSCSSALFKSSNDNLGIVWEETNPDREKKPCSTFFWSTFDGYTWSEPQLLFTRDECCNLIDALMLEDGVLLLMWDEPLVQYTEYEGETTGLYAGHVVFRAYIKNSEQHIEWVIDPGKPLLNTTLGYSFVRDSNGIWCVFSHTDNTDSFYKSWSETGRNWSPPEQFFVPGSDIRDVLPLSQGKAGVLVRVNDEKDLVLLTSTDWENWSEECLLKTENGIRGSLLTEGRNGTLRGFVVTGNALYFVHFSQESSERSDFFIKISYSLSLLCGSLLVLYILVLLARNPDVKIHEDINDEKR